MRWINKQELKFLMYSCLFAIIFFVIIVPLILPSIDSINPFIQFLIFNLGLVFFLSIFLKSITTTKKFNLGYSIGLLLLFLALDCMVPPLSVGIDGNFNTSMIMGKSSSDYIFGLIWNSLGIGGFALFCFVYVITPLLSLLGASILLKNFVNEI